MIRWWCTTHRLTSYDYSNGGPGWLKGSCVVRLFCGRDIRRWIVCGQQALYASKSLHSCMNSEILIFALIHKSAVVSIFAFTFCWIFASFNLLYTSSSTRNLENAYSMYNSCSIFRRSLVLNYWLHKCLSYSFMRWSFMYVHHPLQCLRLLISCGDRLENYMYSTSSLSKQFVGI